MIPPRFATSSAISVFAGGLARGRGGACAYVSLSCSRVVGSGAFPVRQDDDEDVSPYREMKTLARVVELVRQDCGRTRRNTRRWFTAPEMLAELDPHSDFMDPEDFEGCRRTRKGEFGSLGVVVGVKDGQLTVVAPMEERRGSGRIAAR